MMTSTGFLRRNKWREFFVKITNSQIFFLSEDLHCFVPCLFSESDCPSEMVGVEGGRKRSKHHTRIAMDFDPAIRTLHNQVDVEKYLLKYGVCLPSNVRVDWCPSDTNYTKAPRAGGMYLHPQVLALELSFPMTGFIRDILRYYQVAPSQLVAGHWRVVLSFQTLCNLYLPDACRVENFSASYTMKKTKENACFLGVKSDRERLIVNLVDSNHGWHDTVIRISRA